MSIRHLDRMFRPRSIAVIGASERPDSPGRAIFDHLLDGGFEGPVFAVNRKHREVRGHPVYRHPRDLPEAPDLAVICTPALTVADLLEELGERGTRAAVIVSSGFESSAPDVSVDLRAELVERAGRHGLRFLGPNCVGLIVPGLGVNASFAAHMIPTGRIAFVSQSGALATTVLDWAADRDIGFSSFVSLGNAWDVDIGDVIDYLGSDAGTRSILLYMEALEDGRKFMSAGRAASRNKPLVVVKAGRVPEGARAAASHTGALVGRDAVYAAAIRRAGALRVQGVEDLFRAAELLARVRPFEGDRLAILTNGGGPGVLATDELISGGGRLTCLEDATLERLDAVLPEGWPRSNPVDIMGDATSGRYISALEILLEAEEVDAVLVVHAPTSVAGSDQVAAALADLSARARKPVFGCWLGGASARAAYEAFAVARQPSFFSPADAVAAFIGLQEFRANQVALMEIPSQMPTDAGIDPAGARAVLDQAREGGRQWLSEIESKQVLAAYGIPTVDTRAARTPEDAASVAKALGFPVALKAVADGLMHKSSAGGVALDLQSAQAVRDAAEAMATRLSAVEGIELTGFSIQPMVRRPGGIELIIGSSIDPVFGPVILFGSGGTAVELLEDTVIGLPPLNMSLARQMVDRTRASRLLAGSRHHPESRVDLVCDLLVRVARMMIDLEALETVDINPVLADSQGVIALDARMALWPVEKGVRTRPAIAPYPLELAETIGFGDGQITIRPIRPEDEPAHREFFESLEAEDIRFRFFGVIREPQHSQLARFTQIDYEREMAFVAVDESGQTLGVVRLVRDSSGERAEFAVVIRSNLKGRGLGRMLLEKGIRYCRDAGVRKLVGQVLRANTRMLSLARDLGFKVWPADEDGIHDVVLDLSRPAGGGIEADEP